MGQNGSTISVTGTGTASAPPDVAEVRLGVRVARPSAAEARREAAEAMARVLDAVRSGGVDSSDLRTAALSLQPQYDHGGGRGAPELVAYEVTNLVIVTVRDLERLGGLVDGALAAGATSLDGLSFAVSDPAPLEAAARRAAVADARMRAETIAAAAGVALGGVVSIAEELPPAPGPRPMLARAAMDAGTPIEAGTTDVRVALAVVFALE